MGAFFLFIVIANPAIDSLVSGINEFSCLAGKVEATCNLNQSSSSIPFVRTKDTN